MPKNTHTPAAKPDTAWFRHRLADRQMSQRELARKMGLDAAAVSLMFRGRRAMKLTEAGEIARLLGCTAEEIIQHAGVRIHSAGAKVAIVATMDGHAEVHFGSKLGTLPRPSGDLPATAGVIQCRTTGTPLEYMDRWLLFIEHPVRGVSPDALERLSACKLKNGIIWIAQVRRGYQKGRWNLAGPTTTASDVELEWATPVVLIVP